MVVSFIFIFFCKHALLKPQLKTTATKNTVETHFRKNPVSSVVTDSITKGCTVLQQKAAKELPLPECTELTEH